MASSTMFSRLTSVYDSPWVRPKYADHHDIVEFSELPSSTPELQHKRLSGCDFMLYLDKYSSNEHQSNDRDEMLRVIWISEDGIYNISRTHSDSVIKHFGIKRLGDITGCEGLMCSPQEAIDDRRKQCFSFQTAGLEFSWVYDFVTHSTRAVC